MQQRRSEVTYWNIVSGREISPDSTWVFGGMIARSRYSRFVPIDARSLRCKITYGVPRAFVTHKMPPLRESCRVSFSVRTPITIYGSENDKRPEKKKKLEILYIDKYTSRKSCAYNKRGSFPNCPDNPVNPAQAVALRRTARMHVVTNSFFILYLLSYTTPFRILIRSRN